MTDRHAGYVVTLENDIREDDAKAIINAIRMVKGVVSVDPVISDLEHLMARCQIRRQFTSMIYDLAERINDLPENGAVLDHSS